MGERRVPAMHQQLGIGHVAPAPVRMEGDRDLVAVRAERMLQKGCRADAIFGLPAGCRHDDLVRIGCRLPRRDGDLPARDGEGLHNEAGGRLPQPIADLIVEGDVLFLGRDVDVVAQAVEQLRPVGLRVDRLKIDVFDENALLRAFRLGVEVDAARPCQRPASRRNGPRLVSVSGSTSLGLGEDIVGYVHAVQNEPRNHSHSIVAGGLPRDVVDDARLMPRTSLMMRLRHRAEQLVRQRAPSARS